MKRKLIKCIAVGLATCMLCGCAASPTESGERNIPSVEESSSVEESNVVEESSSEVEIVDRGYREAPALEDAGETVVIPEGIKVVELGHDEYVADEYSAYVGEKYILLIDKGVELPKDYVAKVDDIVDAIEEITGLSFATAKNDFDANQARTNSGERAWVGVKSGGKFIIQLNYAERTLEFLQPTPGVGHVMLKDNGLDTFPGERVADADYNRMIEELLTGLFNKYYPSLTREDCADEAIKPLVIEKLQDKYPDLKRMVIEYGFDFIPADVTAENVEKTWVETHLNWEDFFQRWYFEKLFIQYLVKEQGADTLSTILNDNYADREMPRAEFAARIKSQLGEDTFVNFLSWVRSNASDRPEQITLDASAPGTFTADNNYYIEGENCLVYIEKGVVFPNDYVKKADAIVAALEKAMWDKAGEIDYGESMASNTGVFYGISNHGKLPIVLCYDEDDLGLISGCWGTEVHIYDYGMHTNDMKNIEYSTLAHECSHAIMEAVGDTGKIGLIMTEGTAEFYAESVLKQLNYGGQYYLQYYNYGTPINADTAEDLFFNDFSDLTHAERGAEYYYGYYLSKYLNETYGANFLTDITDVVKSKNIGSYAEDNDIDKEIRTGAFKALFGDDLFTKFGAWFVKQ